MIWSDAVDKHMRAWSKGRVLRYGREFRALCKQLGAKPIDHPQEPSLRFAREFNDELQRALQADASAQAPAP
jgi:hypothetical protein